MKIEGRGKNPNSHHNKPKLGLVNGEVGLTPQHWAVAQKLGGGGKRDRSKGLRLLLDIAISAGAENVDKLFATLPALGKSKVAIELLLGILEQIQLTDEQRQIVEYAEGVLYDLQDLEIESLYEEAAIEGDIKPSGDAWIA